MKNRLEKNIGRPLMTRSVILGDAAGLLQEIFVVPQRSEPCFQSIVIRDRASGTERRQIASLLELPIIGPECDRQTESRSFERIVDAHAKPTADITPSRITVDRSQQPDGICLLYTSPSPRDAHESRVP